MNLYKTVKDTNIGIEGLVVHEDRLNTIVLGDITLRFISPNVSKISKLKSWAIREKKAAEKKERLAKSKKASKNLNYAHLDEALVAINLEDTFEPDTREPNGSSFAFILEYGDKRLLFLGDCHMDIVEAYLAVQDKRQSFDLVKLSHHSSEHNNSQEFFNQINCQNFVVCSDGNNSHGHPSMKTIARLTKTFPKSLIHFTSDSDTIKTFTQSFEDRCRFPLDNVLEFTYDLSK